VHGGGSDHDENHGPGQQLDAWCHAPQDMALRLNGS